MLPPSTAHLTKQQVQQMRDWRMKYGQKTDEVRAQKTVRNMSTKDNPGTTCNNAFGFLEDHRRWTGWCQNNCSS